MCLMRQGLAPLLQNWAARHAHNNERHRPDRHRALTHKLAWMQRGKFRRHRPTRHPSLHPSPDPANLSTTAVGSVVDKLWEAHPCG
jgi:hypothetical protein